MNRETLLAMARSRSYIITAAPDERARIESGSWSSSTTSARSATRSIDLPYVTRAYRAVRP